jgi:hypothetical protein
MPREKFSRTATQDVRGAMATALAAYIAGLEFDPGDGSPLYKFAQVFDEWPSYLDRNVDPSACVLPNSWKYGPALLTPVLIEATWEPKGMPGWGLWKTAEAEVEFELSLRASSPVMREKLILGIEDAFQSTTREANRIILDLPTYYGVDARYSLLAGRVVDNEEQAAREQRDAVLTISAQANKVVVRPVYPMALNISINSVGSQPPS